jgi:hypothetical protein
MKTLLETGVDNEDKTQGDRACCHIFTFVGDFTLVV